MLTRSPAALGKSNYQGLDNLEIMVLAKNYNQFLLAQVDRVATKSARIVDFGAGIGTHVIALRERGFNVACVEPDADLRARLQDYGLSVHKDISDLTEDADLVFSFNVLEHLEDDVGTLRQIVGRLSPGGRVVLLVPAFPILFSSMDAKVGHHRRYRRSELRQKLARVELTTERIHYVDCAGFVASLLFRLFGNAHGDLNARHLKLYDRFAFPASRVLDRLFSRFVGKNLLAIARKASS